MSVRQDGGRIYRSCFIGVLLGSLLFAVGFCIPAWASYETSSWGLWQVCYKNLTMCTLLLDESNSGFYKALRALESVSMFFSVVACIIGLYCNCIKAQMARSLFNKNVEISAIISVTFGVSGLILFATRIDDYLVHLSSGFILVCVAQAITGISAVFMLMSRRVMLASARQQSMQHRLQGHDAHLATVHPPDCDTQADHQVYNLSMDTGLPPYETAVNCLPKEPAPPPYEDVAKM